MRRAGGLVLLALALVGCVGGGRGGASSVPATTPSTDTIDAEPRLPDDAWRLIRPDGTEAELSELAAAAEGVEVVFVGERHGNPGGHRFQRELFERLLERPGLVLSLEMFERDVQPVLDEYLDDLVTEEHFLAAARPWPRYRSDHRPLVELARAHGVPVVAANAPRRYVNRVSRLGPGSLADLPAHALDHLPPLPFPGPSDAYREEWNRLMGDGHGHAPEGALQGQALWDATMAHSVALALEGEGRAGEALREGADPLVVHVTGAFHVENRTGTPEALERYRPGTRTLVVVILPVDDPARAPEVDAGLGDWLVVTRAAAPPER